MQFNSLTLLWCLALVLLFWVVIIDFLSHMIFCLLKPIHLRLILLTGSTIGKSAIKNVTSDWLPPQCNPTTACWSPYHPKFQIEWGITKFKNIFQGTDAVSNLIEHLHGLSTKVPLLIAIIKHPQMCKETQIAQKTVILKTPSSYSENCLWVVPRISDYSQNIISLNVHNCANVNIPTAELQAFSSRPYSPIKVLFTKYLDQSQRSAVHDIETNCCRREQIFRTG